MRLGVVVTDESSLPRAVGLLDAAHASGWETSVFLTHTGVNLLAHDRFVELARAYPNIVSLCEHSVEHHAGDRFDLADHADVVIVGGQYQNAELARKCDKVLVF
jgi:peroxiredoxin family protein